MPLKIGLTGGIASGKSTVCRQFAELGIKIIDADRIAHELVEPGSPALEAIVARFGDGILADDGSLDRGRMRQKVFADEDSRNQLEHILHPRILKEMVRQAESVTSAYCILDIPLLVEEGLENMVDRVLVVDIPVEIQRQRLKARDKIDDAQIDRMLAAQTDRATRLRHADDIIDNSQSLELTEMQVSELASEVPVTQQIGRRR